ncbi:MAG: dUTPase [Clostridiales bacterium]|nr:dUTPase [Clostridiales bacterium]
MKICKFFTIQKELVDHIVIDESLSEYKLFARKHLQLHIKMSDLANETKCSTYWIDNNENNFDKDSVLEKYIICLQQIIVLGIDNKYDDLDEINVEPSEYCLSDQFLNLYIDINDMIISPSRDHYITLLEDYFSLSFNLGLTFDEILDKFSKINSNLKIAL